MARSPLVPPRGAPAALSPALRSTLSGFRFGAGDPTTVLEAGEFWRATLTPDGPGTLHLDWRAGALSVEAFGPGEEWLRERVPAMTGALDPGFEFDGAHPVVMHAQHHHRWIRFGASGTLYHDLLPTVLGQRITAGEALAQWRRVAWRLGRVAPGPRPLRLPPHPDDLVRHPAWWFHPLGIEARRAETLRTLARHARSLAGWSELPPAAAAAKLQLIPGVGSWTVGSALAITHGDPDSVAVGDFHLKHMVVNAFTGRARGTDEEMLELLQPYAGQRGRVVRLLMADGHRAPKFGPRQRVLPIAGW
jgi:3-methyladenine DNA glycosylase/8-oxoguanine DNA glycosylase